MMLQEEQKTFIFDIDYVYIIIVLLIILWSRRRKTRFQQRMVRSRYSSISNIDEQKIILAIELNNLIFQTSDRKLNGFQALQIQIKQSSIVQKVKKLFGYGAYYKLMYQKNKIKSFFKSLKNLTNIEIYLYTSLNKKFAQTLLKKIGIDQYFSESFRRYCQEQENNVNQKKHPTWIDHNTRRVIIMTPNKTDFDQQDKKYFLVLNRIRKDKLLKGALSLVKQILNKVKSIDELHNQMDEIQAQLQTQNQNDQHEQ